MGREGGGGSCCELTRVASFVKALSISSSLCDDDPFEFCFVVSPLVGSTSVEDFSLASAARLLLAGNDTDVNFGGGGKRNLDFFIIGCCFFLWSSSSRTVDAFGGGGSVEGFGRAVGRDRMLMVVAALVERLRLETAVG